MPLLSFFTLPQNQQNNAKFPMHPEDASNPLGSCTHVSCHHRGKPELSVSQLFFLPSSSFSSLVPVIFLIVRVIHAILVRVIPLLPFPFFQLLLLALLSHFLFPLRALSPPPLFMLSPSPVPSPSRPPRSHLPPPCHHRQLFLRYRFLHCHHHRRRRHF